MNLGYIFLICVLFAWSTHAEPIDGTLKPMAKAATGYLIKGLKNFFSKNKNEQSSDSELYQYSSDTGELQTISESDVDESSRSAANSYGYYTGNGVEYKAEDGSEAKSSAYEEAVSANSQVENSQSNGVAYTNQYNDATSQEKQKYTSNGKSDSVADSEAFSSSSGSQRRYRRADGTKVSSDGFMTTDSSKNSNSKTDRDRKVYAEEFSNGKTKGQFRILTDRKSDKSNYSDKEKFAKVAKKQNLGPDGRISDSNSYEEIESANNNAKASDSKRSENSIRVEDARGGTTQWNSVSDDQSSTSSSSEDFNYDSGSTNTKYVPVPILPQPDYAILPPLGPPLAPPRPPPQMYYPHYNYHHPHHHHLHPIQPIYYEPKFPYGPRYMQQVYPDSDSSSSSSSSSTSSSSSSSSSSEEMGPDMYPPTKLPYVYPPMQDMNSYFLRGRQQLPRQPYAPKPSPEIQQRPRWPQPRPQYPLPSPIKPQPLPAYQGVPPRGAHPPWGSEINYSETTKEINSYNNAKQSVQTSSDHYGNSKTETYFPQQQHYKIIPQRPVPPQYQLPSQEGRAPQQQHPQQGIPKQLPKQTDLQQPLKRGDNPKEPNNKQSKEPRQKIVPQPTPPPQKKVVKPKESTTEKKVQQNKSTPKVTGYKKSESGQSSYESEIVSKQTGKNSYENTKGEIVSKQVESKEPRHKIVPQPTPPPQKKVLKPKENTTEKEVQQDKSTQKVTGYEKSESGHSSYESEMASKQTGKNSYENTKGEIVSTQVESEEPTQKIVPQPTPPPQKKVLKPKENTTEKEVQQNKSTPKVTGYKKSESGQSSYESEKVLKQTGKNSYENTKGEIVSTQVESEEPTQKIVPQPTPPPQKKVLKPKENTTEKEVQQNKSTPKVTGYKKSESGQSSYESEKVLKQTGKNSYENTKGEIVSTQVESEEPTQKIVPQPTPPPQKKVLKPKENTTEKEVQQNKSTPKVTGYKKSESGQSSYESEKVLKQTGKNSYENTKGEIVSTQVESEEPRQKIVPQPTPPPQKKVLKPKENTTEKEVQQNKSTTKVTGYKKSESGQSSYESEKVFKQTGKNSYENNKGEIVSTQVESEEPTQKIVPQPTPPPQKKVLKPKKNTTEKEVQQNKSTPKVTGYKKSESGQSSYESEKVLKQTGKNSYENTKGEIVSTQVESEEPRQKIVPQPTPPPQKKVLKPKENTTEKEVQQNKSTPKVTGYEKSESGHSSYESEIASKQTGKNSYENTKGEIVSTQVESEEPTQKIVPQPTPPPQKKVLKPKENTTEKEVQQNKSTPKVTGYKKSESGQSSYESEKVLKQTGKNSYENTKGEIVSTQVESEEPTQKIVPQPTPPPQKKVLKPKENTTEKEVQQNKSTPKVTGYKKSESGQSSYESEKVLKQTGKNSYENTKGEIVSTQVESEEPRQKIVPQPTPPPQKKVLKPKENTTEKEVQQNKSTPKVTGYEKSESGHSSYESEIASKQTGKNSYENTKGDIVSTQVESEEPTQKIVPQPTPPPQKKVLKPKENTTEKEVQQNKSTPKVTGYKKSESGQSSYESEIASKQTGKNSYENTKGEIVSTQVESEEPTQKIVQQPTPPPQKKVLKPKENTTEKEVQQNKSTPKVTGYKKSESGQSSYESEKVLKQTGKNSYENTKGEIVSTQVESEEPRQKIVPQPTPPPQKKVLKPKENTTEKEVQQNKSTTKVTGYKKSESGQSSYESEKVFKQTGKNSYENNKGEIVSTQVESEEPTQKIVPQPTPPPQKKVLKPKKNTTEKEVQQNKSTPKVTGYKKSESGQSSYESEKVLKQTGKSSYENTKGEIVSTQVESEEPRQKIVPQPTPPPQRKVLKPKENTTEKEVQQNKSTPKVTGYEKSESGHSSYESEIASKQTGKNSYENTKGEIVSTQVESEEPTQKIVPQPTPPLQKKVLKPKENTTEKEVQQNKSTPKVTGYKKSESGQSSYESEKVLKQTGKNSYENTKGEIVSTQVESEEPTQKIVPQPTPPPQKKVLKPKENTTEKEVQQNKSTPKVTGYKKSESGQSSYESEKVLKQTGKNSYENTKGEIVSTQVESEEPRQKIVPQPTPPPQKKVLKPKENTTEKEVQQNKSTPKVTGYKKSESGQSSCESEKVLKQTGKNSYENTKGEIVSTQVESEEPTQKIVPQPTPPSQKKVLKPKENTTEKEVQQNKSTQKVTGYEKSESGHSSYESEIASKQTGKNSYENTKEEIVSTQVESEEPTQKIVPQPTPPPQKKVLKPKENTTEKEVQQNKSTPKVTGYKKSESGQSSYESEKVLKQTGKNSYENTKGEIVSTQVESEEPTQKIVPQPTPPPQKKVVKPKENTTEKEVQQNKSTPKVTGYKKSESGQSSYESEKVLKQTGKTSYENTKGEIVSTQVESKEPRQKIVPQPTPPPQKKVLKPKENTTEKEVQQNKSTPKVTGYNKSESGQSSYESEIKLKQTGKNSYENTKGEIISTQVESEEPKQKIVPQPTPPPQKKVLKPKENTTEKEVQQNKSTPKVTGYKKSESGQSSYESEKVLKQTGKNSYENTKGEIVSTQVESEEPTQKIVPQPTPPPQKKVLKPKENTTEKEVQQNKSTPKVTGYEKSESGHSSYESEITSKQTGKNSYENTKGEIVSTQVESEEPTQKIVPQPTPPPQKKVVKPKENTTEKEVQQNKSTPKVTGYKKSESGQSSYESEKVSKQTGKNSYENTKGEIVSTQVESEEPKQKIVPQPTPPPQKKVVKPKENTTEKEVQQNKSTPKVTGYKKSESGQSSYESEIVSKQTGKTSYENTKGEIVSTQVESKEPRQKIVPQPTPPPQKKVLKPKENTTEKEVEQNKSTPKVTGYKKSESGQSSYESEIVSKQTGKNSYENTKGEIVSKQVESQEPRQKIVPQPTPPPQKKVLKPKENTTEKEVQQNKSTPKFTGYKKSESGQSSYESEKVLKQTGKNSYENTKGEIVSTQVESEEPRQKIVPQPTPPPQKKVLKPKENTTEKEVQQNKSTPKVTGYKKSEIGQSSYESEIVSKQTGKNSYENTKGEIISTQVESKKPRQKIVPQPTPPPQKKVLKPKENTTEKEVQQNKSTPKVTGYKKSESGQSSYESEKVSKQTGKNSYENTKGEIVSTQVESEEPRQKIVPQPTPPPQKKVVKPKENPPQKEKPKANQPSQSKDHKPSPQQSDGSNTIYSKTETRDSSSSNAQSLVESGSDHYTYTVEESQQNPGKNTINKYPESQIKGREHPKESPPQNEVPHSKQTLPKEVPKSQETPQKEVQETKPTTQKEKPHPKETLPEEEPQLKQKEEPKADQPSQSEDHEPSPIPPKEPCGSRGVSTNVKYPPGYNPMLSGKPRICICFGSMSELPKEILNQLKFAFN